jgi:hypothetical protein
MFVKSLLAAPGYLAVWILLLPIFVLAGVAVLLYTILCELGALLIGGSAGSLDLDTARATARRICQGYEVSGGPDSRLVRHF